MQHFKKVLLTLGLTLSLFVGFSCSQILDNGLSTDIKAASRNISPQPVQLISIQTVAGYYHGYYYKIRNAIVKVQNIAFEKTISLYGEYADGGWGVLNKSEDSTYLGPAEDGWELWEVKSQTVVDYYRDYGDELVIRYTVGGQTYWDNNQGENYQVGDNDGTILTGFAPAIFSEGQWYSEAPVGSGYAGTLTIYASLKNLSPEKGVQLVLTNNDWISHTAADFDYVPYYYYGWFDQPIASPNAHGIERWRISYKIPLGSDYSRVRFALKYDDGGLEHWDNNFTHNYSLVDLLD
jgi:hypothetical protein